MKSQTLIFLVVSAVVFAGCQHRSNSVSGAPVLASADASPNEAIRTAIQVHLAHNGNLSLKSFDTEVKQVNLDGDHAQAQVEFHVKSGPGSMRLTYALAKRDGTWLVVGSTPGGSNFSHPALDKTQAPAAGETMVGDSAIFRALDNFHSSAATPPRNLPPGHTSIVASPNDKQARMP
jgi:hypothetical protein